MKSNNWRNDNNKCRDCWTKIDLIYDDDDTNDNNNKKLGLVEVHFNQKQVKTEEELVIYWWLFETFPRAPCFILSQG